MIQEVSGSSLWVCRSALYSIMDHGEIIKLAHHGIPSRGKEQVEKIILHNLKHQEKINQIKTIHLVSLKEALRYNLPLGSEIVKTYQITWEWDNKRILLNPHVDIWIEWSNTLPHKTILLAR